MGVTTEPPHRVVTSGLKYKVLSQGASGFCPSLLLGILLLPCVKCLLLSRISDFLWDSFDSSQAEHTFQLWVAVKQFFMASGNPFVQRGKGRVSATRDSSDVKWGEDSEVQRSVLLSWTCLWPWMSHLTLLNLTFLKQSGVVVLTSWNWYDDLMRQYMQSIYRCPAYQREAWQRLSFFPGLRDVSQ